MVDAEGVSDRLLEKLDALGLDIENKNHIKLEEFTDFMAWLESNQSDKLNKNAIN